jgi:D-sedoheptulose 7-phosphate isomerase
MLNAVSSPLQHVSAALRERNLLCSQFFDREADRIAEIARSMAERFLRNGRLLAFGRGACATDAQHISVEFVHPVIVGKRALPALDISSLFDPFPRAIVQADDIVVGFGPPNGDPAVELALEEAHACGAMILALPGDFRPIAGDPFQHQEAVEMLYHMLWETVHVFLEHSQVGYGGSAADFLYPFLGSEKSTSTDLINDVAASIRAKAEDDARLRSELVEHASVLVEAANAMSRRIAHGGKLLLFGNGGSATDANDWAIDCFSPPEGLRPIPAISLAMEPACISAIANDVGTDLIFLRQLVAHGRREDVAVAISTSGGSRNILIALEEARKRGMLTIGLLGYDGGEILKRGLVDHAIVVHSDYIPRIQEVQASAYHILRELMEMCHGENN